MTEAMTVQRAHAILSIVLDMELGGEDLVDRLSQMATDEDRIAALKGYLGLVTVFSDPVETYLKYVAGYVGNGEVEVQITKKIFDFDDIPKHCFT